MLLLVLDASLACSLASFCFDILFLGSVLRRVLDASLACSLASVVLTVFLFSVLLRELDASSTLLACRVLLV